MVSAVTFHRRLLVALALAAFAIVLACSVLFEVPGLGIGHFFYVPVALLALACGARVGALGGALATGLYTLAIVITPRLPVREILTLATGIRFVTYTFTGALIGWFASSNRDLVARLSVLAERDFLTDLLNARVFDEALARRCASDRPFVLVLGDMDNLKEINDAHGHAEGNRALRRLAERLSAAARPDDELARVGGDEFALLTDAGVDEAVALCARLRKVLAAEGLEISFGWATKPGDGFEPLELFRKADDRLYAAKLIVRNRRVIHALAAAAH